MDLFQEYYMSKANSSRTGMHSIMGTPEQVPHHGILTKKNSSMSTDRAPINLGNFARHNAGMSDFSKFSANQKTNRSQLVNDKHKREAIANKLK